MYTICVVNVFIIMATAMAMANSTTTIHFNVRSIRLKHLIDEQDDDDDRRRHRRRRRRLD